MELDTRAPVPLDSDKTFYQPFPGVTAKATTIQLNFHLREPIAVRGQVEVEVK